MTRVLVVEDDPVITLALSDDLAFEGYEVTSASTGTDALAKAQDRTLDIILLDLMLPGADGFQICRELRRRGVRTPIIMLTARTLDAEKVMGLELGADDYVTKPYAPAELRARIRSVLRRMAPQAVHRFGDVEADFERHELRRSGKPLHATPTELRLLFTFVRNPGRALTRAFLRDQVWGHDAFMTDRVIDTHVSNLRRKIEVDATNPRWLVSVRGVGYRFDDTG